MHKVNTAPQVWLAPTAPAMDGHFPSALKAVETFTQVSMRCFVSRRIPHLKLEEIENAAFGKERTYFPTL